MTCMLVQCPYTSAVCMGIGCQYYQSDYKSEWYFGKMAKLSEFTDNELIEELNNILEENEQLLDANAILHAKVAALRAENQRLADICEEQDVKLDKLIQTGDRLADALSAHLSHNA